ncbi:hypothetical protein V6N13_127312 [Hibiscus sabdariffa]|uniref:Uncharacterized protein n=1 Tax=Hibiscus sabdariffa TaxID=183260 RepID=A0ABR2RCV6_9ROSI
MVVIAARLNSYPSSVDQQQRHRTTIASRKTNWEERGKEYQKKYREKDTELEGFEQMSRSRENRLISDEVRKRGGRVQGGDPPQCGLRESIRGLIKRGGEAPANAIDGSGGHFLPQGIT